MRFQCSLPLKNEKWKPDKKKNGCPTKNKTYPCECVRASPSQKKRPLLPKNSNDTIKARGYLELPNFCPIGFALRDSHTAPNYPSLMLRLIRALCSVSLFFSRRHRSDKFRIDPTGKTEGMWVLQLKKTRPEFIF